MQNQIKRGQIWIVDIGETTGAGSEQRLMMRPIIVTQNDKGNLFSPTVTIVPLTSQNKKWLPTHVTLYKTRCLMSLSIALVEQMSTVSKERFIKFVGYVDDCEMMEIGNAIMIQNGLVDVDLINKNNMQLA
jgi:mRNA interferase MazF